MMILRSSPASPFARKVRIASNLLRLDNHIDVRGVDLNDPADNIRIQNPLGKIPTLVLDDGTAYYDSRVILDYLDHIAGSGRIVPPEAPARFAALQLQALCDGVLDACLLIVYESRYRAPDKHEQSWIDRQADKVARGLSALDAAPPALDSKLDSLPNVGQIALACLLGYRDLRFDPSWRKTYPRLHAWHDDFAARVPAFAATKAER